MGSGLFFSVLENTEFLMKYETLNTLMTVITDHDTRKLVSTDRQVLAAGLV